MCIHKQLPPSDLSNFDFEHRYTPDVRQPLDVVFIDLKELPATPYNYKYLLIFSDQYSKYVLAEPLQNRNSQSILQGLIKQMAIIGTLRKFVGDMEGGFKSRLFEVVCSQLGVEIAFITTFSHHFGQAEKAIEAIAGRMKTLLAQNETHDWTEDTALACWAVNTTLLYQDLTPYQLMFGRRSNYQSDLMSLDIKPIGPMPESHAGYLRELRTRMRELQSIMDEQRT